MRNTCSNMRHCCNPRQPAPVDRALGWLITVALEQRDYDGARGILEDAIKRIQK